MMDIVSVEHSVLLTCIREKCDSEPPGRSSILILKSLTNFSVSLTVNIFCLFHVNLYITYFFFTSNVTDFFRATGYH